MEITFFGCGDHINSFRCEDKKRGWEFVSEKPELGQSQSVNEMKLPCYDKTR
jgi:hypothetical protein